MKFRICRISRYFLAITSIDHDELVLQTLQQGGSRCILKSQSPASIIQSVRDALRSGTEISPNSHIVKDFSRRQGANRGNHYRSSEGQVLLLTHLEKQILRLLCQGLSNAEISEVLYYSQSAVKKKVSKLIHDFGVSSRLGLVVHLLNSSGDA